MDLAFFVFLGAGVGLLIGITGVGGGSLMTPVLLSFGIPLHVAVGTDLMYAAVTKSGGIYLHVLARSIQWRIVLLLSAGSIPAAMTTILLLKFYFDSPTEYAGLITTSLGIMLILTSVALLFNPRPTDRIKMAEKYSSAITFLLGVALGVCVTLSSVGAAAIATVLLMLVYPRLRAFDIIGTNLAHAVPLTLVAGLGHAILGNIDYVLLGSLLVGSLPGIYVGTRLSHQIPDRVLQPLLGIVLLAVGVRFAIL